MSSARSSARVTAWRRSISSRCPAFTSPGNLYRPLGRGKGPFPAILNPHGHWKEGRLADTKDGSVAARCISFARQGMIAFSYDMVGYNDTFFPDYGDAPADKHYSRHRHFATNQVNLLWNVSLMGLQTWDSIRALDFLESLPDVDRKRLACTGESGGGTQTFMLGAVEDRLAAQAPVVMVSHRCKAVASARTPPGLRVEYSNMEIAAAAAPRPQILVASTGDWTKDTLTVEGPAIEHIYQLLNAPDKFRYVRFDFGHNYNQTSREAVYAWFGKWLLKHPDPASLKEEPYQKEPDAALRVFPDGKLPEDALTEAQIIESLKDRHRAQWESLVVRDEDGWEGFKRIMQPAWRHTLQVAWPGSAVRSRAEKVRQSGRVHCRHAHDQPLGRGPGHPGELLGSAGHSQQPGAQSGGHLQRQGCRGAAGRGGKARGAAAGPPPARPGGAHHGSLQHRRPARTNSPISIRLTTAQNCKSACATC